MSGVGPGLKNIFGVTVSFCLGRKQRKTQQGDCSAYGTRLASEENTFPSQLEDSCLDLKSGVEGEQG